MKMQILLIPAFKNIREHKLYYFQKRGSTFQNGLLLEIAAQLLIEPDDFREFSSLLLSYYGHFQIEEFDKAVSTNVSNTL